MLNRIIFALIALILAQPAGSQSRSDSSAVSNLFTSAAQAYSQKNRSFGKKVEFPKTQLGRVAVVSAPLIAEGLVAKK